MQTESIRAAALNSFKAKGFSSDFKDFQSMVDYKTLVHEHESAQATKGVSSQDAERRFSSAYSTPRKDSTATEFYTPLPSFGLSSAKKTPSSAIVIDDDRSTSKTPTSLRDAMRSGSPMSVSSRASNGSVTSTVRTFYPPPSK